MANPFLDFRKRTNVEVKEYDDTPILLYEDHRVTLNVLKYGFEKGFFADPPNLICFDYHDDFLVPSCGMKRMKSFYSNSPNERDFHDFVEFELSGSDDDWIITGLEFQLINDVILIGVEDDHNLPDNNEYIDHLGNKHGVYSISHICNAIDNRGQLGDLSRQTEFKDVRDCIQFNSNGDLNFNSGNVYPFILDIDLDCFSTDIWQIRKAVPYQILSNYFGKYISHAHRNSKTFFNELFKRSQVMTIAKESGCCGGFNESQKILSYLNDILFHNELDI